MGGRSCLEAVFPALLGCVLLAGCVLCQDIPQKPTPAETASEERSTARSVLEDYVNQNATYVPDGKEITIGEDYMDERPHRKSENKPSKNAKHSYSVRQGTLEEEDAKLHEHNDELRKKGAYLKPTQESKLSTKLNKIKDIENDKTELPDKTVIKSSKEIKDKKSSKLKEREVVIVADYADAIDKKLKAKNAGTPKTVKKSSSVKKGGVEEIDDVRESKLNDPSTPTIANDVPYKTSKKEDLENTEYVMTSSHDGTNAVLNTSTQNGSQNHVMEHKNPAKIQNDRIVYAPFTLAEQKRAISIAADFFREYLHNQSSIINGTSSANGEQSEEDKLRLARFLDELRKENLFHPDDNETQQEQKIAMAATYLSNILEQELNRTLEENSDESEYYRLHNGKIVKKHDVIKKVPIVADFLRTTFGNMKSRKMPNATNDVEINGANKPAKTESQIMKINSPLPVQNNNTSTMMPINQNHDYEVTEKSLEQEEMNVHEYFDRQRIDKSMFTPKLALYKPDGPNNTEVTQPLFVPSNITNQNHTTRNISGPVFIFKTLGSSNSSNHTDRARNQSSRLSSTTTLTVNVKDDDDQNPSFIYQGCAVVDGSCVNPEYYTTVSSGVLAGVLTIHPEKIQAVDMDSLNTPIEYSFLSGKPENFREFFEINPSTGVVRQVRPVDSSVAKKFTINVKAEEASEARRFATAKLVITVKPVDANPPALTSTAKEGFVEENSPIGTRILDANDKPIRLAVTDADLGPEDPKPSYVFELTTNFFDVDPEGYLVVGDENLDRDPPSPGLFRFQVVAREKAGTAASSPLTLAVVLTDVNDNAPRLPMIPPVEVQAGEGHREIVNVTATDNDLGENAVITYSIYHVSNNGRNKFQIDPHSGVIESVGKLNAGEQYSITVQATDAGGKYSQTIVEIKVVPGPNTRSPVFKETTYEVTVSEGAPINSTVTTISALDPEKDPVTYSIIAGNDLRQFGINDKTGVISVRRKLDREDLTRYQLLIKAEDEGGLSSTATVNIHVSDINDKNPEFIGEPYDWKVREGLVGAHVGVVEATDADEGINANITYSVPDEVPFTINPQTGTVMTSTSLDYEKQKEYKFVVTAKDGGTEPRLATATVTVSVVDVEDEMPIFHKPLYEATVPENTPDYFVTQVTADDPDTVKRITYVMKQGPTELFSVDPHDGTIRTLKGLDFESEPEYDLVIGTVENNRTQKGSTTTVRVRVTDVNDIPPVFLTTPVPVSLDDNVSIGTMVTTVMATDSDGTAPGNKIRYEIVGRGKAVKYFQIDPDLGTVTVRDDLRKESDNEYQVDVKAYDLGDPQLSSITSIPVFVRHVAIASPPIHLGFPDDSYTLQIPEDTKPGSLLKSFAVISSSSVQQIPLRCSIIKGNVDGLFSVNITGEKTCDLMLGDKPLDYEKKNEYILKLRLESLADYVNHNKSVTTVKIQVTDVNDNVPKFVYPNYSKLFKKNKYFGAVSKDKKEVRTILQVKAEDKDSSGLTDLEYRLAPSDMNEYFSIDPSSGSIKTRRSVDTLPPDQLPVKLTVLALDGKEGGHTATAEVVINVINENDWLILPISKVSPDAVSDKESQIADLLSQATGKLVGVEKIGPLESTPDNVTLNSDPSSTDLWLYFIDPQTEKVLSVNDSTLAKTVHDEDVVANITAEVTTALGGGTILPLHSPVKVRAIRTAVVALDWEVFPYAVILIAGLILVLGTAGIVYICISWQRYKAYKERMQRMYVMPRYDPVFVEPNLKEYETQVLQMSVPMDDNDSYHDLQLDFSRKNHAFSLDNVSYITKDHGDNGGQSPASSEAATTTRASSLGRHNNNIHRDGAINLSYDRSDDEMGHNSSPTNENVTFREKKDYSHLGFNYLMDRSPIETTTEL